MIAAILLDLLGFLAFAALFAGVVAASTRCLLAVFSGRNE